MASQAAARTLQMMIDCLHRQQAALQQRDLSTVERELRRFEELARGFEPAQVPPAERQRLLAIAQRLQKQIELQARLYRDELQNVLQTQLQQQKAARFYRQTERAVRPHDHA